MPDGRCRRLIASARRSRLDRFLPLLQVSIFLAGLSSISDMAKHAELVGQRDGSKSVILASAPLSEIRPGEEVMSAEDQTARSAWITVWFSPRETIERLVAGPPMHLVWSSLAVLGLIAIIYQRVTLVGGADVLRDWKFALGLVLLGAVAGIVSLYLQSTILGWIGKCLGGQATVLQMRAVFAWSMLPIIVSSAIVLIIHTATERGAIASGAAAILSLIFSIWSLIIFLLMLGRVERFGFWRTIITYFFAVVLFAFGVALFVRSFAYQSFNIPSGSMRPTLLVGDYIFVSKFAYGYSRYSLPFSPPLPSGPILFSQPAPGDVAVFRHPKDTATDYVKRIVGLPGDRIQMQKGQLYINDVPVQRERLADVAGDGACGPESGAPVKHWRETLPNGASYETLDCLDNSFFDNTIVHTVPDGHFFALGDNRDNSTDSRMSPFGPVPFENLIGRVSLIYFSYDSGSAGKAAHVRTERPGIVVR
jgi:signal peptidase I